MPIRTDYGALRETLLIPTGVFWQRAWPVTDPDSGAQLSISGWSARCQIRERPDVGAPVLFEWGTTPGAGIGTIALATGLLTIVLTGSESADWNFRRAFYDVYLTDPAGHPTRLVEGRVLVIPAVTH